MERLPTWGPSRASGWDVDEYYGLLERGVLTEEDRVELLEGAIVAGEPQGPSHGSTVWRIQRLLERTLGERAIVRGQLDYIAGRRSVPVPDVAVVPMVPDEYADEHPTRAHVVFEIAYSSLWQDRLTKGPIYAKNGVPQYVLVNLRDRTIENHTRPSAPRRRYLDRVVLGRGERLTLVEFPDVSVGVDELLGVRVRR